ncbi:hypothetical protein Ae406Ps2_6421c [Pseudonocardia sp. Ae406_Ps2]|nr:hypothetical protein Ae406Ps2_6421c [Pseudonocardia sp. Ae406_Ps2]
MERIPPGGTGRNSPLSWIKRSPSRRADVQVREPSTQRIPVKLIHKYQR